MRNRKSQRTPTQNDAYEPEEPVVGPVQIEPEVDEYADAPYVTPSLARAMAGEQVDFGSDVPEDTDA